MLDCKQLQVGDFCVATVPRSRNELPTSPMPLMPPLASVTDLNPALVRSRSETSSSSSNARKRRASFLTQPGSVSLPAYQSGPTWNPWMSARVSPEVEKQEQEQTGLEQPVEPTDLRTSKSREEEEEHLSSWENIKRGDAEQSQKLMYLNKIRIDLLHFKFILFVWLETVANVFLRQQSKKTHVLSFVCDFISLKRQYGVNNSEFKRWEVLLTK